jgi:hypothetical protein
MKIVERYQPREFSAISTNTGIVLCDREEGAFIVLRFPEDVQRLRALLDTLDVATDRENVTP